MLHVPSRSCRNATEVPCGSGRAESVHPYCGLRRPVFGCTTTLAVYTHVPMLLFATETIHAMPSATLCCEARLCEH